MRFRSSSGHRLILLVLTLSLAAAGATALAACGSSSSDGGPATPSGGDGGGGDAAAVPVDGGGGGGGSDASKLGGDASMKSCTYTTTGSVATTGTCTFRAAADTANNQLGFSFTGSANSVSFGGAEPGTVTLKAGTFTLADVPEAGGTFLDGTTSLYGMCNNGACADGKSNPIPNQGTFTLTITDPGAVQSGVLWSAAHGSLHMLLPADPNTTASGTVTLDATF